MISSKEVSDLSPHSGRFRARFSYTLDDGRVLTRGPSFVADSAEADAKLIALESDVLANVQNQDASEAVRLGSYTLHKEASENQVKYAWLLTGYEAETHVEAYAQIKDLAPAMLSLGYTDEQYASAFNTTVEEVVNIKAYWSFLDANSAAILAYGALVDPREAH